MIGKNFNVPFNYTLRKVETNGNDTLLGFSKIGDSEAKGWDLVKINVTGSVVSVSYARNTPWQNRSIAEWK